MSNNNSSPKGGSNKTNNKFQGRVGLEDLKGNAYSCGVPGQAERHIRTTKAVAEYVALTYGEEMWSLVHERQDFVSEEPEDPGAEATPGQLKKYEIDYKEWQKETKQYKKDKAKVFRTRTSYEIPEPVGEDDPLIDLLMSLELETGRWVLAVAVRDEVTQETSYVSTSIEMAPQETTGPES